MNNRLTRFTPTNRYALKLALGSFAIGSLIFMIEMATGWDYIKIVALFYLLIAFISNTLMFLIVVVNTILHTDKKQGWFTLYCLLINIPIAIGYLMIIEL